MQIPFQVVSFKRISNYFYSLIISISIEKKRGKKCNFNFFQISFKTVKLGKFLKLIIAFNYTFINTQILIYGFHEGAGRCFFSLHTMAPFCRPSKLAGTRLTISTLLAEDVNVAGVVTGVVVVCLIMAVCGCGCIVLRRNGFFTRKL